MAIVNRTSGALAFSTTTNVTIPAVASGNALLILITSPTARAPTNVTDNGGGSPTYTNDVAGAQLEGASNPYAYIYRRCNITTGPTQITITTADSGVGFYNILEIDNLKNQTYTQAGAETRAFDGTSSVSVTTATANEIGVAFVGTSANTTATTPTDWTKGAPGASSDNEHTWDNPDLGAAGTKTFTTTLGASLWNVARMYTYEAESSATNASSSASGVGSTAGVGTVTVAADRFPIPPFVSMTVS